MNLRLYLFVSDVIEKNDGERQSKISSHYPREFRERVVYLVCVECL